MTLIEAEALEAIEHEQGIKLAPGESRRNVTTRGVPLNHLVGREFTVGDVRLRGVKLCEPCGYLQRTLGIDHLVQVLAHRCGLNAEILTERGDPGRRQGGTDRDRRALGAEADRYELGGRRGSGDQVDADRIVAPPEHLGR